MKRDLYIEAYGRLGTYTDVAREFGVNESTVRKLLKGHIDPAMQGAMQAVGTHMVPSMAWIKTKATKDTPGHSVMLRPQPEAPEAVAERIRDMLEGLEPAPRVPTPETVTTGLLGLHVIADIHMGAVIETDEAESAYNPEIAKERLRAGFAHCAQAMPACEVCIILYNGDTTHANSDNNKTPKSGHPLKVQGTHQSNIFAVEEVMGWQVQLALEKHSHVWLVIKKGNHDPNTPTPLIMAMRAFWRDNPRVTVVDDDDPYFVFQMGRVFVASHHGDGAAPAKRAQSLQHKYRAQYGISDFHWFFTGDKHHAKADTFGGLHWRQVPSVISLEQHSHAEGYADTSGMYAAWFDTATGRVSETTIRF